MNIEKNTTPAEMKQILGELQKQRNKTKSIDCNFTLSIKTQKGRKRVEQTPEGRIEITGEDLFQYILAAVPKVKVNGPSGKRGDPTRFQPEQKNGSRLLLSPFHLAYYIPYDDLFNNYNWYLYKRVNNRISIVGGLIKKELWLPQYVELVVDEKQWVPVEVKAYIYNTLFVAAEAKIEYDANGLPVKQTVVRRLPDGEDEFSVLELTNVVANKRQPKKRWIFF